MACDTTRQCLPKKASLGGNVWLGVIAIDRCVTNYTKSHWLQTALTISQFLWVRNLSTAQPGLLFQEPSQAVLQVSAGPQSHLDTHRGRATSQLTRTVVGRIQLDRGPQSPPGCWLEATLGSLPRGPLPHGSSQHGNLLYGSKQAKKARELVPEREDVQGGSHSLCKLISEFHHFCRFLFIRGHSLGPAHTEGT